MISGLYTGILGLFYIIISIEVIIGRIKNKISLGPGKNNEILRLISSHDNFAAYTPIFLISLSIYENIYQDDFLLHLAGLSYLSGRVFHHFGVTRQRRSFILRRIGVLLSFFPILLLSVSLIYIFIKN